MEAKELKLESRKKEAVLLVGKRKVTQLDIKMGQKQLQASETMQYLGIQFNRNMGVMSRIEKRK